MKVLLVLLLSMVATQAYAGQVTVPNTFTTGTKAKAAEVNANFTTLKQSINDNDARISQNTSDIYSHTTTIQTNASAILGNAANISTNTSSIGVNTNTITTLQQAIPTTYQVVDSYATVLGDLLGTDLAVITFISSQGYLSQGYSYQSILLEGYTRDAYASVDCTGPITTVVDSYYVGKVFDLVTRDAYANIITQNRHYVPLNAVPTGVLQSALGDPLPPTYTRGCNTNIQYYLPVSNDSAVTGIPNVIGHPLSIKKK